VSYEHPHHALLEEVITIDFMNSALGAGAWVAVEMTLQPAKEPSGALPRRPRRRRLRRGAGAASVTQGECNYQRG
jgi:hypothetical protein